MSMSMSSTNLVFEFLLTWHQKFLEAVAFFDKIGGAQQGHLDRFQSAVASHWETRLLIGSIHFLHLTFESISKPRNVESRVSHTDESYLFDFIFKLFEISSTFHLRRQFDFHQLVQSNQINNIVFGAFRCKQLDDTLFVVDLETLETCLSDGKYQLSTLMRHFRHSKGSFPGKGSKESGTKWTVQRDESRDRTKLDCPPPLSSAGFPLRLSSFIHERLLTAPWPFILDLNRSKYRQFSLLNLFPGPSNS